MAAAQHDGRVTPRQTRGEILANEPVARDTFRLRVRAPELAAAIKPGQFAMVRPLGSLDPLLARPYALWRVCPDGASFEIVYLVLGNGTRCLSAARPGAAVDVWGPLGNVFPVPPPGPLLLVAGGIGQTPFLAVAQALRGPGRPIALAYGARNAGYFAGLEDFRAAGVEVRLATDDGSAGRQGYVTALVEEALASATPPAAIFGCGPEPMLEALCRLAEAARTPCWVSLEAKMACGYGVCFSCVAPVRTAEPPGWDYRRTCVEGPIFPAAALAWGARP
jgi:dihydroorotate dehydrogenase electron transfer subunit